MVSLRDYGTRDKKESCNLVVKKICDCDQGETLGALQNKGFQLPSYEITKLRDSEKLLRR